VIRAALALVLVLCAATASAGGHSYGGGGMSGGGTSTGGGGTSSGAGAGPSTPSAPAGSSAGVAAPSSSVLELQGGPGIPTYAMQGTPVMLRPALLQLWRWTFRIGLTAAQSVTWDALHACDRLSITWGHIKLDGSFTYGGLEYEIPKFQACMRERGFAFP